MLTFYSYSNTIKWFKFYRGTKIIASNQRHIPEHYKKSEQKKIELGENRFTTKYCGSTNISVGKSILKTIFVYRLFLMELKLFSFSGIRYKYT